MKTTEEVLSEVNEIFIDVLDDRDLAVDRSTTAQDIDEWDSLNHILLVTAIEKHFKIRFTTEEIEKYKNVGEMCDGIQEKMAKK